MDSQRIKVILVFVIALIAALYLGITSATAQLKTVIWVVGGISLITCILLGNRIWMIIPFLGTLNLTFAIPGNPNTMLIAQVVFLGFGVLLFLMRKLNFQLAFSELSFWNLLLSLCLLQAYLRNPIGLQVFGGDSLGGRPYMLFLMTLVCSILLSGLTITASDLKWHLRLSIIGGLLNFLLLAIGHFVPSIGIWFGAANVGATNDSVIQEGEYGVVKATRIMFVRDIGRNLAAWITAFISPIRACFKPLWAPLVILSLAFAGFSGYRNEIISVGLTYVVGIAYRGGGLSLIASLSMSILGLIVVAFLNLVLPLPANIQRSLSFLPGTWDQAYVKDSQDSTEWRIEMWKEALFTDFWIKNKIFGDGLGMTRTEYNYILSFKGKNIGGGVGSGKLTRQQEFMMASGSYHSGPVITIRAIGYVGLIIFLFAQFRLAVHSHRQIQRTRNSEWFPLALLIGMPLIWSPIYFVFVFGEFGAAASSYLMGAAYVRLLERNLPLPPYVPPRQSKYVPLTTRQEKLI